MKKQYKGTLAALLLLPVSFLFHRKLYPGLRRSHSFKHPHYTNNQRSVQTMRCPNCGYDNTHPGRFCFQCGAALPTAVPTPVYYPPASTIPEEYKPLSPWAYYGYSLLYTIPVVGFIALICIACGASSNKNAVNYARSYFCGLLITLILAVVLVLFASAFGITLFGILESYY